jgi:HEAT repeat protein
VKRLRSNETAIIWSETLLLILVYGIAIALTNRYFLRHIEHSWFALALGFCVVQCAVVVVLLSWLMLRKQYFLWLKARAERLYPEIQQQLALVALGTQNTSGESVLASEASGAVQAGAADFVTDAPRHREFMRNVRSIRDRLSFSGITEADLTDLRALQARYPLEFESCFVRFVPAVSGVGRDRLSHVADQLGLVAKWQSRYESRNLNKRRQAVQQLAQISTGAASQVLLSALNDPDVLIRIEAARGLVRGGGRSERERLFLFLSRQPLLVRSMLVVDLLPYSDELSQRAIPEALDSPDSELVLVTLQILEAWGRVLPVPGYERMLWHEQEILKAQAYRSLPFVAHDEHYTPEFLQRAIKEGLAGSSPLVRAAAATSAGRLDLAPLVPQLGELLEDAHTTVATAAAFALAQIDPSGPRVLEQAVVDAPPEAAATALEALEKLHLGRL